MASSDLEIHIKTTADNAAANASAAAMEKVAIAEKHVETNAVTMAEAEKRAESVQAQATVTTNGLAKAKEEVAKSTGNAGRNMMIWGQAVQDAQYGVGALANQAGQLAMTLGLGAGVGGVALIAATGLNLLIKNVDIFGTEAEEAAKKMADLAEATDRTAYAARLHAEQVNAEQASAKRFEDRLRDITEEFRIQTKEINLNADAINRRLDAEQRTADTKAAGEMAEIDVDEKTGKISAAEAVIKRRDVQKRADQDKLDREQKRSDAEAAKEADIANARQQEAASKRMRAEELEAAGRYALDADDKKRLEASKEALEAERKKREAEIATMPDTVKKYGYSGGMSSTPTVTVEVNQRKEEAKRRLKEAEAEQQKVNDQLRLDAESRRVVGGRSQEEIQKDAEALRRDAAKKDEESQDAIRRRDIIKEDASERAKLFPDQQSVKDKKADAQLQGIKRQEEEKAQREAERDDTKEARERAKFNSAANNLRHESRLLPPAIQKELESQLRGGPDASAELNKFFDKLGQWLKKKHLQDTDFAKRLEKMEAVVNDISDGK